MKIYLQQSSKNSTPGSVCSLLTLTAEDLLAVADSADDALLFSIRAQDNSLRNEQCRATILHVPPSRAMVADALIQYLAWKRWNRAVLVIGRHANDKAYAKSLKRAAKRFGVKIIEEKQWTAVPGARRTDSGHHNPHNRRFRYLPGSKNMMWYLVADEADEFGEYLSYRATSPRPVAGTQGLLPTSWHRTQEQWGATQITATLREACSAHYDRTRLRSLGRYAQPG